MKVSEYARCIVYPPWHSMVVRLLCVNKIFSFFLKRSCRTVISRNTVQLLNKALDVEKIFAMNHLMFWWNLLVTCVLAFSLTSTLLSKSGIQTRFEKIKCHLRLRPLNPPFVSISILDICYSVFSKFSVFRKVSNSIQKTFKCIW